MKAVVGVGFMKYCLAGVDIFAKLKFPSSEAVLVHAVESVLPDGGFLPASATNPIADIQRQRQEDGEKRMSEIAAALSKHGIPSRSVTAFGNPAHEITDVATKEEADMIVSGSGKKGGLESFIMGSVTRALVMDARRSILVGKQELSGGEKINAVFATDHSDYADRCIDRLVELSPSGFGMVTVVSANTMDPNVRDTLDEASRDGTGLTVTDVLERRCREACAKLAPICETTDWSVLQGNVTEVINAAMKRTGADLLIIGAHGHGFLERLVMGSTAMHVVGNEPWNTLVLRV